MLNSIELLDRFEILEPSNLALKDLRRCIVNKDVRSVFKMFKNIYENDNIHLVETACLDLNAYAFFKLEENLIGNEDMPLLKKIIWQQNPWAVFNFFANQDTIDPLLIRNVKNATLMEKPKALLKLLIHKLGTEEDPTVYFLTILFYNTRSYDLRKVYRVFSFLQSKGIDIYDEHAEIFIKALNGVPIHLVRIFKAITNDLTSEEREDYDLTVNFFEKVMIKEMKYDIREIYKSFRYFNSKMDIHNKDKEIFEKMMNKVHLHVIKFLSVMYPNQPWIEHIRKFIVLEDKINYIWKICKEFNFPYIKELELASKNKYFGMKMKPVFDRYKGNKLYDSYQNATNSNANENVRISNTLDVLKETIGQQTIIDDIKGSLLYDNREALYNVVKYTSNDKLVNTLQRFESEQPSVSLNDAFSRGQLFSKKWIVNKIKDMDLGTIVLCAGWHGSLIHLFARENIKFKQCFSFDINSKFIETSELLNKDLVLDNWKFKATHADILELDYNPVVFKTVKADGTDEVISVTPDTIINTSCDHIKNYDIWYNKLPKDKLLILQNNNYFEEEEHVNSVKDLDTFKEASPMSNIVFEGTLNLGMYKRFMLIGYK